MTEWDKSKALRAKRALTRAKKAGGGNRLSGFHFYPEIARLQAEGWSHKEMARYFKAAGGPGTDRRIRQIIAEFETKYHPSDKVDLLPSSVQSMLEWSVPAFERFFLEFSQYDYLPEHVKPWLQAFMDHRNLLLNVPPRHAKSEYFSVWIPIWLICRDRNVQILLVSETNDLAVRWAQEIAGQLEYNERLVSTFGRFKPENVGDQPWKPAAGVLAMMGRTRRAKGAQFTVQSRSMTNQVLGMEADFVIVDDPTSQEAAESETERRRQLKHLREQVFSRAEPQGDKPGGRIAVVGQRVHLLDLYGVLEKQEWEIGPNRGQRLWHTEKYPAVLDWDTKKLLWPQRFPWEEMMLTYARVGGQAPFSCMYQQEPLPEGSALVTRTWIEGCKDHNRIARQGPRGEKDSDGYLPVVRVLSVDPSPTKFNGIVVGDLLAHKDNFVFAVTEVYQMKAGIRELAAKVDSIIERAKPDYFIFEESGFLAWFRDDPWFVGLKDRVKLLLHKTGVNKNSMEYGVQSLAGDFEFERISLPYGDEEARRMTDMLATEALTYPDGDTNDLLMALWFVKFNYRKLSPVRFLPTHRKGSRPGGGWSWMKNLKTRTSAQENAYQRLQREANRAKELSGVA